MFDLALADNGDLIISGHRDLLGRSGRDLLEQRMRIRLIVPRGSWAYDLAGTFGSNLLRLIGLPPDQAAEQADAYVREALRGMSEISISQVAVQTTSRDMTIMVYYFTTDVTGAVTGQEQLMTISLPGAGFGGGGF